MNSGTILNAMFGYNQTMNERLWKLIMKNLTDEEFTQANPYSRGTIRNQIVHMAQAQHGWLSGMLDMALPELNYDDYPTREAARAACQKSDQTIVDTVRGMSEADLERKPGGWSQSVWVGLMQVANHSTDHRAQILRAMHDMGKPTMEMNFAVYMETLTPMPLSHALEEIAVKRGEWDALLRQVSPAQMEQPLVNDWTVRDAVAIITWKERRLIEIIGSRTFGIGVSFDEQPEAERTRILAASRPLPLDALLDQHQEAHRATLDAVRTLTDADLNDFEGVADQPPDDQFWKFVALATWWGYPNFIEPLRELLKGS